MFLHPLVLVARTSLTSLETSKNPNNKEKMLTEQQNGELCTA